MASYRQFFFGGAVAFSVVSLISCTQPVQVNTKGMLEYIEDSGQKIIPFNEEFFKNSPVQCLKPRMGYMGGIECNGLVTYSRTSDDKGIAKVTARGPARTLDFQLVYSIVDGGTCYLDQPIKLVAVPTHNAIPDLEQQTRSTMFPDGKGYCSYIIGDGNQFYTWSFNFDGTPRDTSKLSPVAKAPAQVYFYTE